VSRLPPLLAVAFLNTLVAEYHLILYSVLLIIVAFLLLQNIWLKGVYESHFLSILESWFLLKLAVMIILAIFIGTDSIGAEVVFTLSLAIFFCSFLVILSYHIHLKLIKKTWYQAKIKKICLFFTKKKQVIQKSHKLKAVPFSKNQPFTHSSLQLERQDSVLDLFNLPSDTSYEAVTDHDW
jgi:hypothetical protein